MLNSEYARMKYLQTQMTLSAVEIAELYLLEKQFEEDNNIVSEEIIYGTKISYN